MLNLIKLLLPLPSTSISTPSLESYNINPTSISISGFSAGGFMSAQLGIAYSSLFQSGFGVFAGGPYDCARNQDFMTVCLGNNTTTPSIEIPIENMKKWSHEGKIDDLENLKQRRVFLEIGEEDDVVGFRTMRQLGRQLGEFVDEERNMKFVELEGVAHAFPTDFDAEGNSPLCGVSESPFIANCGYDGAGEVLKWLYGNDLKPKGSGSSRRQVQKFSQTGKFGALGLAKTGYVYVPDRCKSWGKTSCKLHVALHGCTMSYEQIGDKFIQNTGYLPWAEANDIVVLFPQATVDKTLRPIWNGTNFPGGALACFDWVGWVDENADQKGGVQMVAIVNMVNKLMGEKE